MVYAIGRCSSQFGSFVFFFSSRRRHTRLTCDWSSDVCSSDLRRVQRPFAFIGFLLFFVGLRFFLDPHAAEEATAVGRQTTGLVPVLWSLMFVVGEIGRASCRERV